MGLGEVLPVENEASSSVYLELSIRLGVIQVCYKINT